MRGEHWVLLVMCALLGFLVGDLLAWSTRASVHGSSTTPMRTRAMAAPPVLAPASTGPDFGESSQPQPKPPRVPDASSASSAWSTVFERSEVSAAPLALAAVVVPARSEVARFVRYYSAGPGRGSVSVWLRRARPHVRMIQRTLQSYGVPKELLAVAIIESGMQPDAVSPAGATGMWQFMPETARGYQLYIGDGFDERRDPELATNAAARHLRDLYLEFRDWPLALAAYNAGLRRVREELQHSASEDFWTLAERRGSLAQETVDYVPKVLAMVTILTRLGAHGFAPITDDEQRGDYVRMNLPGLPVSLAARALGMSTAALRQLNPSIVGERIPDLQTRAAVLLPSDRLNLAQLLVVPLVHELDDHRLIKRVDRLQRGAIVASRNPGCGSDPCASLGSQEDWERLIEVVGGSGRTYQLRSGDTAQKVADHFGVDAALLLKHNEVRDPRRMQVGQLLRLPKLDQKPL